MTKRGKRRLVMLVGLLVLGAVAVLGLREWRKVQERRLAASTRIEALERYDELMAATGEARADLLDPTLQTLSQAVAKNKQDYELLYRFADVRRQVEAPGGAHLVEAAGLLRLALLQEPRSLEARRLQMEVLRPLGRATAADCLEAARRLLDLPEEGVDVPLADRLAALRLVAEYARAGMEAPALELVSRDEARRALEAAGVTSVDGAAIEDELDADDSGRVESWEHGLAVARGVVREGGRELSDLLRVIELIVDGRLGIDVVRAQLAGWEAGGIVSDPAAIVALEASSIWSAEGDLGREPARAVLTSLDEPVVADEAILGRLLYLCDLLEADELLETLLARNPEASAVRLFRVQAALYDEGPAEAIEALGTPSALDAGLAEDPASLGRVAQLARLRAAIESLRDRDAPAVEAAAARLREVESILRRNDAFPEGVATFIGQWADAVDPLESSGPADQVRIDALTGILATQTGGEDPLAWFLLGRTYLDIGLTEAAVDAFERVTRRRPTWMTGIDALVSSMVAAGRPREALVVLQQLSIRHPELAEQSRFNGLRNEATYRLSRQEGTPLLEVWERDWIASGRWESAASSGIMVELVADEAPDRLPALARELLDREEAPVPLVLRMAELVHPRDATLADALFARAREAGSPEVDELEIRASLARAAGDGARAIELHESAATMLEASGGDEARIRENRWRAALMAFENGLGDAPVERMREAIRDASPQGLVGLVRTGLPWRDESVARTLVHEIERRFGERSVPATYAWARFGYELRDAALGADEQDGRSIGASAEERLANSLELINAILRSRSSAQRMAMMLDAQRLRFQVIRALIDQTGIRTPALAQQAIEAAQAVVDERPSDAEAARRLLDAYGLAGSPERLDEARVATARRLWTGRASRAQARRLYIEAGRTDELLERLEDLPLEARTAEEELTLVRLHLTRGDTDGARAAMDRLDGLDPAFGPDLTVVRAQQLVELGDGERADALLREVLSDDPLRCAIARSNVALRRGDLEAARGFAEDALALDPAENDAHYALIAVLESLNGRSESDDSDEIRRAIVRGLQAIPDDQQLATVALAYFQGVPEAEVPPVVRVALERVAKDSPANALLVETLTRLQSEADWIPSEDRARELLAIARGEKGRATSAAWGLAIDVHRRRAAAATDARTWRRRQALVREVAGEASLAYPDTAEFARSLLEAETALDNLDGALIAARRWSDATPASEPAPRVTVADILLRLGRAREAIAVLRGVQATIEAARGGSEAEQARFATLLKALVIAGEPVDFAARYATGRKEADLGLAGLLLELGRPNDALSLLAPHRAAIEASLRTDEPDPALALLLRARIQSGEDAAAVAEAYRDGAASPDLDRWLVQGLRGIGVLLDRSDAIVAAESILADLEAAASEPSLGLLIERAYLEAALGEHEAAIGIYVRILEGQLADPTPDRIPFLNNLAHEHAELGRECDGAGRDAVEEARRLLSSLPETLPEPNRVELGLAVYTTEAELAFCRSDLSAVRAALGAAEAWAPGSLIVEAFQARLAATEGDRQARRLIDEARRRLRAMLGGVPPLPGQERDVRTQLEEADAALAATSG